MSDFGYKGLRVRSDGGRDPYLISPYQFVRWIGMPPSLGAMGGKECLNDADIASIPYGLGERLVENITLNPPQHSPPSADCTCGIYIARTFESCVENMGLEGDILWVVIVTSGKHIESEGLKPNDPRYNIVRVEKARVASIIPPSCMVDNHMSEYLREESGGWGMQYLCKTCKELYAPGGRGRIFALEDLAKSWGVTVLWDWWDKVRGLLARPKSRWDNDEGYIYG